MKVCVMDMCNGKGKRIVFSCAWDEPLAWEFAFACDFERISCYANL